MICDRLWCDKRLFRLFTFSDSDTLLLDSFIIGVLYVILNLAFVL